MMIAGLDAYSIAAIVVVVLSLVSVPFIASPSKAGRKVLDEKASRPTNTKPSVRRAAGYQA